MKKLSFLFASFLLIVLFTFSVFAADTVVYVDGSSSASGDGLTPETAFRTLGEGITAAAEGGTVVLVGDVTYSAATILPTHSGKILVTSEYGGTDYNASIILKARIIMGGEIEFDNINFENSGTTQRYILARNYPLTIGAGVTTTSTNGGMMYPIIAGGRWDSAGSGNNVVTVKGGTWHSIIGGNVKTKHTGNSEINFLGGTVLYAVAGGSSLGAFEGNATVNIGGSAVVELNTEAGVIGANIGDATTTAYTFTGNVNINIYGDAKIYSNIFGVSRRNNVTMSGDITIDIYGNAETNRHIYGGGFYGNLAASDNGIAVTVRENANCNIPLDMSITYLCAGPQQGTVTGNVAVTVADNAYIAGSVCGAGYKGTVVGNSSVEMTGGDVGCNLTAGSATGTVDGNASVVASGGTVGSRNTAANDIRGNGGYTSDTVKGTVSGTSAIVLDGTAVTGDVTLGGATGTVTLKSGSANTAADTVDIDLSAGGDLKVGGDITANSAVGGGALTLSSAGSLTAASLTGDITVYIDGKTWPGTTYVTVTDTSAAGTVTYGGEDAKFTKTSDENGVYYTIDGIFSTTAVTVTYYNPDGGDKQPDITFWKYGETSTKITEGITYGTDENGHNTATVSLTPGLYYYNCYYASNDYQWKYFYISGKEETLAYTHEMRPYQEKSYMETRAYFMNDEIIENFFNMNGFKRLDTPTFTNHADDNRTFMSNAEICEYIENLNAECDYMYVYYPFPLSEYGNKYPVIVFTKDDIPADATFEEVGEIVQSGGIREILMTTGGVHGIEPTGVESQLVFAKEMAGEYGENILANEKFGAVVIIPCVSVDNYQRLARQYLYDETLPYEEGINPQRNLMALQVEGTQNQVYVYKTFLPTVYIDNHEDFSTIKIDPTDYSISYTANGSLSHFEDVAIRYSPLQNSPIVDIDTVIGGETPAADQVGMDIQMNAIGSLNNMGLRAGVYYVSNTMPNTSWPYAKARGSYGFLIETMRIWSGKTRYERAVFAQSEAIMAITDEVFSRAGEMAKNVYDGRQAAAVTEYDENNVFAKSTTYTKRVSFTYQRNTVYIDGTVKDEAVDVTMGHHDTVSDFVSMATAYVIPADESDIDKILNLLDMHGIKYTKIRAGSTLTLRKYAGLDTIASLADEVTIGDSEEVTFENGAYVITTDTSDAYLITYLFEPDSFPYNKADEHTHSITHMGYITGDDALYRSETSYMSTVIADLVEVLGDIDGDGDVDIADVMTALTALVNDKPLAAADMNGDGKVSLVDIIRILKLAVA
ncbi:MAG: hypothetical protein IJ002_06100 [Clostridia bacterium]|nr:hypothetical protein [Clostridia bacterium]